VNFFPQTNYYIASAQIMVVPKILDRMNYSAFKRSKAYIAIRLPTPENERYGDRAASGCDRP
jgi:hypothetical protein